MTELRNIAIIAHVDHGKTSLIDVLLRQSGQFRDNQKVAEFAMDSNELERERGITILAKCTSLNYNGQRINIVDTPGHADFGGEVERILSMVDGVVLLVDASEGPMPQTKFVLAKALKLGLRPIVFINKVDKADQRAHAVHDEVFDLFAALDATDEQLDFPTLFGSAKEGWAAETPEGPKVDITPLFELIWDYVAPPSVNKDEPFAMLVTTLESDPYLGRILTGKISAGIVRPNMTVKALSRDGSVIEESRITKVLAFRGLERISISQAEAGDIVAIAGLTKATVADTICDVKVSTAFDSQPIDPPTLSMTFSINDSPLAGQDGNKLTSRVILARLEREAEGNVALHISKNPTDGIDVAGRGELQLAVLIETLRREGFELSISRPQVLFQVIDGQKMEPVEEVVIDVDEEFSGIVIEKLGARKSDLVDMRPSGAGKQRLVFHSPSRSLIGYHGEFMTDTHGTGIMNRLFHGYVPYKGVIENHRPGVIISLNQGKSVAYALWNLEARGIMFIGAGEPVYAGMVIGEHSKMNDIEVNPLKGKQLTNIRASGTDEAVRLTTPVRLNLDKAIAYIGDDELVEVTPSSVRIRKRYLNKHERKRNSRRKTS